MAAVKNTIDPFAPEHHGKPLWCVYGPNSFPTLICCRIKDGYGGLNIWGYSVWKGEPGFRTLGQNLKSWIDGKDKTNFFADQSHALEHLAKITKPKPSEL